MTLLLSVLARLTTPKMLKTHKGDIYFNINLAWECWRDIKLKALHRFNSNY